MSETWSGQSLADYQAISAWLRKRKSNGEAVDNCLECGKL